MSNTKGSHSLSERRDARYVCNLSVNVKRGSIFQASYPGKIIDINISGVRVLSEKIGATTGKATLRFSLDNGKELVVSARMIWQERIGTLCQSGWRFVDMKQIDKENLAGAIAAYSIHAMMASDRRSPNLGTSVSKPRTGSQRLGDAISSFDLLKSTNVEDYRRKTSDRRTSDRRKSRGEARSNDSRRDDRRAIERRADKVKHDLGESALGRTLRKMGAGFRDYMIFWMPKNVSQKLIRGRTFAFITHPRDIADVSRQYPLAKWIPDPIMKFWLKWQWPVIGAEIKDITTRSGEKSRGWLIFCPLTAKQMIRDRGFAKDKVLQAVRFAEKVGAQVVGLGAFTSIVTSDGQDIAHETNIGVTSGNALSAAAAVHNIAKICAYMKRDLSSLTVAIVGAAGNVGSVCARSLYGEVKELILVDINRRNLGRLCDELHGKETKLTAAGDVSQINTADVVIAVTNAPGAIVRSANLKKGAIVVDAAQPKNVSDSVPAERSDVIVVESAILKFPKIDCHFDLGIGPNETLGCMAETIVLDAIGWHKNYSIGKLTMQQASDIMAAAKSLGVDLAYFRNSAGYVTEQALNRAMLKSESSD